jgi:hypothetical protein
VLYCPDIDPQQVQAFLKEAALLRHVAHQNVVELRGVCVLPPTVCLVLELCDGGSLHDFLRGMADAWHGAGASLREEVPACTRHLSEIARRPCPRARRAIKAALPLRCIRRPSPGRARGREAPVCCA